MDTHRLFAGEHDSHGSLQKPRREGCVSLYGEVLLAAEGATVGNQLDLDPVPFDAEDGGDLELVVVHALTLRPDLEAAIWSRRGQAGLGLEKGVLDALRGEDLIDDDLGIVENGVDVASGKGADLKQVAARVDRRCVRGERRLGRGQRLEDLVLDLDRCGSHAGAVLGVGHDDREHVSDVPSCLADPYQQRPVRDNQPVIAHARDVLRGKDAFDSGQSWCRRRVDSKHARARMLRQHEGAVKHPFDRHVGDEVLGTQRLVATSVPIRGCADAFSLRNRRAPCEAVILTEVVGPPRRTRSDLGSGLPRLAGDLDRVDDAVVSGAAAEMAGESPGHPFAIPGQVLVDQVDRTHGDARRAEAALDCALPNEGVGEELALALWKALEGHDLSAVRLGGVQLASEGRLSVQQDGAAAAHSLRCTAVLDRGDTADFP
jgi:hypothetical protein